MDVALDRKADKYNTNDRQATILLMIDRQKDKQTEGLTDRQI